MNGAITWEQIISLLAIAGVCSGAWWFLFSYNLATRKELQKEIQGLRQELAAYKLEVAERYASVDHLKEVESRLVMAIDKLTDKLDTMPDRLSRIIQQAIGDPDNRGH
jgi:Tfp pilus assembly protein PilO